jgi:hypothetical protein
MNELYQAVRRNCRFCHAQFDPSLDFSTFDQFEALRARHAVTVFEEATMPMSKRAFENFWTSAAPDGPNVLAAFLTRSGGEKLDGPGRPIARTSGDRTVRSGEKVVLDASASLFGTTATWVQESGAFVQLTADPGSAPRGARVSFTAPGTADVLAFRLELTDGVRAATARVNITVTAAAAVVSYVQEIEPIWRTEPAHCTNCHFGPTPPLGIVLEAGKSYESVLKKVDRGNPVASRVVVNATSGSHHGAGPIGAEAKARLVKWISEGAKLTP